MSSHLEDTSKKKSWRSSTPRSGASNANSDDAYDCATCRSCVFSRISRWSAPTESSICCDKRNKKSHARPAVRNSLCPHTWRTPARKSRGDPQRRGRAPQTPTRTTHTTALHAGVAFSVGYLAGARPPNRVFAATKKIRSRTQDLTQQPTSSHLEDTSKKKSWRSSTPRSSNANSDDAYDCATCRSCVFSRISRWSAPTESSICCDKRNKKSHARPAVRNSLRPHTWRTPARKSRGDPQRRGRAPQTPTRTTHTTALHAGVAFSVGYLAGARPPNRVFAATKKIRSRGRRRPTPPDHAPCIHPSAHTRRSHTTKGENKKPPPDEKFSDHMTRAMDGAHK